LDESDANKRNSFLLGLVQKDISRGFASIASDWDNFVRLFDESGFEVYSTRELIEVEDDVSGLLRDMQSRLFTSEALDSIRTRFFELAEFSDSLDLDEKNRLLSRWKAELADFSSVFIGRSLIEWLNRKDQVILF
jgi:hypothetical protein